MTQMKADSGDEEVKEASLENLELIEAIDEKYLSDLKPEDIPDDCVSDVD